MPRSSPCDDSPEMPSTAYLAFAGSGLGAEPIDGVTSADLAIVGGGICGCSLALHAAEAGLDVVLLESRQIGWGASGRNSGHLPAASKFTPQQVLDTYGEERGERLNALLADGPTMVCDLAEKHGMRAEVERNGTLTGAHSPAALRRIEALAEFWTQRRHPVELLDQKAAAEAIGSGYYRGALLDRRGAAINPLAYVRGLARAAMVAGSRVHERSGVMEVTHDRGGWFVGAERGGVKAEAVALCTNAYTGDLWPGLRQSIIPVRLQQYVSKPLPEAVRSRILPGRQAFTDSRRLIVGVRVHSDGRFHFNGFGPGFEPEGRNHWQAALRRVVDVWPDLDQIEQNDAWTGWVAMNRDHSWKIHNPAPGLYAALGCNGRGIVPATLIGQELARHLAGAPERDIALPITPLGPIPLHRFHRPIVRTLLAYYKLRDGAELRSSRRARAPNPSSPSEAAK